MRASRYSPVPFWFAAGISIGREELKGGQQQDSEDQVSAARTEGASCWCRISGLRTIPSGDRMAEHELEA